ncbi:unnamed protein product [Ectocarpus fasciculatus]
MLQAKWQPTRFDLCFAVAIATRATINEGPLMDQTRTSALPFTAHLTYTSHPRHHFRSYVGYSTGKGAQINPQGVGDTSGPSRHRARPLEEYRTTIGAVGVGNNTTTTQRQQRNKRHVPSTPRRNTQHTW